MDRGRYKRARHYKLPTPAEHDEAVLVHEGRRAGAQLIDEDTQGPPEWRGGGRGDRGYQVGRGTRFGGGAESF